MTEDQASGTAPIVITADQEAILAGGDSNALLLQYDVFDEVLNYAEKWSLPTTVAVDAGAWRLGAPIIKQASGGVIDLETLGYDDVVVQILVEGRDFEVNDTIEMKCVGLTSAGQTLTHIVPAQILSEPPMILDIAAPNAFFRAIASGSVEASYLLIKQNGSPPLSSKRAFANIVGTFMDLPAPTVREAQGDTLEPDVNVGTVDIRYPDMKNGDLINTIGAGSQFNGQSYVFEYPHTVSEGDAAEKIITLHIENEHLTALKNGSFELFYRVYRMAREDLHLYGVYESEHLYLKIAAIPGEFPAPTVLEAPDGFLDPTTVPHSATVRVDNPATVIGDEVTCYWKGPSTSGSTRASVPITNVTVGKPINFRIDARFITPNISELVAVRYGIQRGKPAQYYFSETLTLEVGRAIEPEIISVTDSKGPIAPNGITFDDRVRVEGKAHPGRKIQLFDATTSLDVLDVSADGDWDYWLNEMPLKTYRLTANALYGTRPESASRVFTAVETITPTILSLTDSKGEIPQDGITFDKTFTLEGEASPNQRVRILDGINVLAERNVELNNRWTYTHTTSAVKAFSLVAKGLYGVEPESSPPRNFTVAQALVPVISTVTDDYGSVAPGGITFLKSVTLTGTASPNQSVRILDGTTPLGEPKTDGQGGWTHTISGLTLKLYSLTALALYGDGPVSTPPRTFKVENAVRPTITNVTDSRGSVAEGAVTYDKSVTVSGKASPNQNIRLRDGANSLGDARANNSGDWSKVTGSLSVKTYSLTALALYAEGAVSTPARTFRVENAVTPSITSVIDAAGSSIGPGGSTYQSSVAISGSAPGNTQVDLYDSGTLLQRVTVSNNIWSLPQRSFTGGTHTITARSTNGSGLNSPARSFTIETTLYRDFTDFNNQSWNGWQIGSSAGRDLYLRNAGGNWRLNNYTHNDEALGVIIQKTLTNLRAQQRYRFSIKIARYDGRSALPQISIRADRAAVAGPINITSMSFITLSGNFTASTARVTLDVYSHVKTGIGNDYEIDDIEIIAV